MFAYTVPILYRGDVWLFGKIWTVFGISGWFFCTYPVGGWSHALFHLVIALMPPMLLRAACELPASQEQIQRAMQCIMLQQDSDLS